jgi:hypothetical protein
MQSLKKIRFRQLRNAEKEHSVNNAIDFLNLVFGLSPDFKPFWKIIEDNVK